MQNRDAGIVTKVIYADRIIEAQLFPGFPAQRGQSDVAYAKADPAALEVGATGAVAIANVDVLDGRVLGEVATAAGNVLANGTYSLRLCLDHKSVRRNERIRQQAKRKQGEGGKTGGNRQHPCDLVQVHLSGPTFMETIQTPVVCHDSRVRQLMVHAGFIKTVNLGEKIAACTDSLGDIRRSGHLH